MEGQPCWIGLVTLTRRLGARLQGWDHDEEETGDVSIGLERPRARLHWRVDWYTIALAKD